MRSYFFAKIKKSFLFLIIAVLSLSSLATLLVNTPNHVYAAPCSDDVGHNFENCHTIYFYKVLGSAAGQNRTPESVTNYIVVPEGKDEYTARIYVDDGNGNYKQAQYFKNQTTPYYVAFDGMDGYYGPIQGSETFQIVIKDGRDKGDGKGEGLKTLAAQTISFGTKAVKINVKEGTVTSTDNDNKETTEEASTDEEAEAATSGEEALAEEYTDSTENLTCNNAAGGIGWAACTLLDLFAKAITWIYDNVISPSLVIRTSLLDTNSGTYGAWSTFRDIANIIFVIFLLIVILSQITGYGIDNYGIKKSLPKLIAAVILVNLSYFICQAAVDISNILGASLYDFLSNIGTDALTEVEIQSASAGESIKATVTEGLVAGIAAIAIAGGVKVGIFAAVGMPQMFIGFLCAFIGAFIGVLFMFFLLSARQALVVILVALSPLAFACYMLPNTKKIFDRWFSIGKAMLLLYPICSLAMGFGRLAAKIIMGSGSNLSFFIVVTAMVAEIAPFFFIPSLVKGAYMATGQLGARLNRLSGRLSGGARGAFIRSRAAKNLARGAELRQAARISNNYEKNLERLKNKRSGVRGLYDTAVGKLGTTAISKEATMEARKKLAAVPAMNKELEKWTSDKKATIPKLDANGNVELNADGSPITIETSQGLAVTTAQIRQAEFAGDNQIKNALRLNNPVALQSVQAAAEREDEEKAIRSTESLILNGKYAVQGRAINPNDSKGLGDALAQALRKDGSESEISALVNVLSRQGDAGRTAVREAIEGASESGELTNSARMAFASNIMQSHASDYKNNMRAVFDYASANTGENEIAKFSNYVAKATNSLKQEQLASMDEAELRSYADAVNSGNGLALVNPSRFATEQEAREENEKRITVLRALASSTLSNSNLSSGLKESQKAILREIAGDYVSADEQNAQIEARDAAYTERSRASIIRSDNTNYDSASSVLNFADESRAASYNDGTTAITRDNYEQVMGPLTKVSNGFVPTNDYKNLTMMTTGDGQKRLVAHDDNGEVTGMFDPATGEHESPKHYTIRDDAQPKSAQNPDGRPAVSRNIKGYVSGLNGGQVSNRSWGDERTGRGSFFDFDFERPDGTRVHRSLDTRTGRYTETPASIQNPNPGPSSNPNPNPAP
ncbi:hypothetical protein IKF81_01735 [Candidatus Saccharibacteria bacterium]|nr:hypothetical protein [Candidatus Saccharibacteria bacterium]